MHHLHVGASTRPLRLVCLNSFMRVPWMIAACEIELHESYYMNKMSWCHDLFICVNPRTIVSVIPCLVPSRTNSDLAAVPCCKNRVYPTYDTVYEGDVSHDKRMSHHAILLTLRHLQQTFSAMPSMPGTLSAQHPPASLSALKSAGSARRHGAE